MVGLRCTVFYCDWHDNTPDRGVRTDAFGVTSVNSRRKLQYYDPFILASQADQVCYIKYPRVRNRDDPWVTVTRLNPRGRVQGKDLAGAAHPAPLAPAAASAPPPLGPPGVMSVAELVQQPGRDHLPYLTPYPHGRGEWIRGGADEDSLEHMNFLSIVMELGMSCSTRCLSICEISACSGMKTSSSLVLLSPVLLDDLLVAEYLASVETTYDASHAVRYEDALS
uniref:DUF4216 domain-containing protein n=1 Tax=Brassica oleracea var. oleracea TaxID=109376 RepID=A0A0D3AV45_BRAOL